MPIRKRSTTIYIISFSAYCLGLICLNNSPTSNQALVHNDINGGTLHPEVTITCDKQSMQLLVEDIELIAAELNRVALSEPDLVAIPSQDLIREIKTIFGDQMCVSFKELPEKKKEIYEEIALLVANLKVLRKKTEVIREPLQRPGVIA